MREESGQIIIEPNDCIQVVKGDHTGTLGIVLDVKGIQLTCWGRTPAGPNTGSYTFTVDSVLVMHIGKGRIKPTPKGSPVRTLDQAAASARAAAEAPPPPPRIAPEPPKPRPSVRTAPHPQKPQQAPAATQQAPKSMADQVRQHFAEESGTPKAKAAKPEFGGVDSDMMDLRPRPTLGEDIKPELLKPVVYSGVTSRDMHGLPKEQIAPQQPQPVPQENEPATKPKRVNPFRKKTKSVSSSRKVRSGRGKRKSSRQSLGVPVESQGEVAPGAQQAQGDAAPEADNSTPDQQPVSPAVGDNEGQDPNRGNGN